MLKNGLNKLKYEWIYHGLLILFKREKALETRLLTARSQVRALFEALFLKLRWVPIQCHLVKSTVFEPLDYGLSL